MVPDRAGVEPKPVRAIFLPVQILGHKDLPPCVTDLPFQHRAGLFPAPGPGIPDIYCCLGQLFYAGRIVSPGRDIDYRQSFATLRIPAGKFHRYLPPHTMAQKRRRFHPGDLHIPRHIVRHRSQGHIRVLETPPVPPQIEGMRLKSTPGEYRSQRNPIGRQPEHPMQQHNRPSPAINFRMRHPVFHRSILIWHRTGPRPPMRPPLH